MDNKKILYNEKVLNYLKGPTIILLKDTVKIQGMISDYELILIDEIQFHHVC